MVKKKQMHLIYSGEWRKKKKYVAFDVGCGCTKKRFIIISLLAHLNFVFVVYLVLLFAASVHASTVVASFQDFNQLCSVLMRLSITEKKATTDRQKTKGGGRRNTPRRREMENTQTEMILFEIIIFCGIIDFEFDPRINWLVWHNMPKSVHTESVQLSVAKKVSIQAIIVVTLLFQSQMCANALTNLFTVSFEFSTCLLDPIQDHSVFIKSKKKENLFSSSFFWCQVYLKI